MRKEFADIDLITEIRNRMKQQNHIVGQNMLDHPRGRQQQRSRTNKGERPNSELTSIEHYTK